MKSLQIYLLGLFVVLAAAKDLRGTQCDETGCSSSDTDPRILFKKNDFLAIPDMITQLTGVDSPTEEEWIAIINELSNDVFPEYLAERNYTVEANQTGNFNDSDGTQGGWSARSYIKYHVNETNANVSMISGDMFLVNGYKSSTLSLTRSFYTKSNGEIYWDTLRESWTFIPGSDGSYILVGNSSSYANSKYEQTSIDTGEFTTMTTELKNATNLFTVTFIHTSGNETYGKERSFLTGSSNSTSIPLNKTQDLSGIPEKAILIPTLTQGLVRSNDKTHGTFHFTGNYTVGKEGDYNTASSGTVESPTKSYSTTSGLQGQYSTVQKSFTQNTHQIFMDGPFMNMAALFLHP